jgi:hypothetical protein
MKKGLSHSAAAERRRKIAADVRGGLSVGATAGLHKVCVQTVRNACNENRVPIPRLQSGNVTGTGTMQILALLLNTDLPMKVIAAKLHAGRGRVAAVHKQASEAGIAFPTRQPHRKLKEVQ